jgi:1-acyl-sn-glycerol-3-phosphate acyltransferase
MIATAFAMISRLISGATVHWQCSPRAEGQRIYFANHSSHLDFIVIWSGLPADLRRWARPVAGSDYWEQGAIRRCLARRVFNAVLIQRSKADSTDARAAARASIERMASEMGSRNSLIVFPEGTRGRNSEIGNFKSGLYHLARLRPDVELIPVYLENLNRILPKGEVLPVPMLSRVVFGPPLASNINEDKQEFLARARQALVRLKGSHESLQ